MPRFQRPTGTLDILPEDQPYWYHVRARAQHLAEIAGFERIDVPMFEDTQLFARYAVFNRAEEETISFP